MLFFKLLRFGFIFIGFSAISQQLLINEISQGPGSQEYVEFIVAGTSTCQTPVPCLDLRGVLIDDNNGYFASGAGTGIANGAVRFADNSFWSCIPQGTLILVYSETDKNLAIPADDVSMSDGNCRLIIPINSMLFEGQSLSPTPSNSSYPTSGNWIAGDGKWAQITMSNDDDSFQIRSLITSATPNHSVSWGNNNLNTMITFSSAGGNVFSMTNNVDNNAFSQANWTLGAVGTNETPGAANNVENGAWIGSMNPQCGAPNPIEIEISSTPTDCGTPCTGTASIVISGGVAPYTIDWSNGGNATTISDLCAATYTVEVTDDGGCSATEQVIVTKNAGTLGDCELENYNVTIPNVFTPNGDAVNSVFEISITGGILESGFILNRWGNVVHEFDSTNLIWNGTSKGSSLVKDGVYTYIVKIRANTSGVLEQYHGFVTVIR